MKSIKKRLALFLDGTWNTEDDSTNVYHAYSLTKEGLIENDTIEQLRYYDPGVGTGILDSITGGGFGVGLDKNVRQAYNWLVDHYEKGDEIYIFGFSRGAYTARSLMGFLAACGLIKRGAPINISQLWAGYVFTSVNRDHKKYSWWKKTLEDPKNVTKFRRLNNFQKTEEERSKLTPEELDKAEPLNKAERLLGNWSRRVDITYMGIFDTVGAMGWEALALPGLTSKLDAHHNPYPSQILQKCRHALAIDEYRTSFKLSRLENFIDNSKTQEEADEYNSRIKQRWFVGAHSNIGGGYPNNVLAARPFEWIMDGARTAVSDHEGLFIKGYETKAQSEEYKIESCADEVGTVSTSSRSAALPDDIQKPTLADVVDSYVELAGGIWTHIIRAKRHFRPIMRPDLIQKSHALHSISEEIDETVEKFIEENDTYAPANLVPYIEEKASKGVKEKFYENQKNNIPVEFSQRAQTILVIWCIMVAIGVQGYLFFFFAEPFSIPVTVIAAIAFLYVLVNWGEYQANLEVTFKPKSVLPLLKWNFLMWIRLVGILFFFIGVFIFIKTFAEVGMNTNNWGGFLSGMKGVCAVWWPVPVAALVAAIPLYFIMVKDEFGNQAKTAAGVVFNSLITLVVAGAVVTFLGAVFNYLNGPTTTSLEYGTSPDGVNQTEVIAGYVLLSLLLIVIFFGGVKWVGVPMGPMRANLGTIRDLQMKSSVKGVRELFESYENILKRPREGYDDGECQEKAWPRVKSILYESVWSDYLGFIPVYTMSLGLIMWIGFNLVDPEHLKVSLDLWFITDIWKGGPCSYVQWWQVLLAVTVITDLIENWAHLSHLNRYRNGGISSGMVMIGFVANLIKRAGFIISCLLVIYISCRLIWIVLFSNDGGWRWILATGVLYLSLVTVVPAFVKLTLIPWMKGLFASESEK
ncbi:MAG: DUF2235 domain-containing protein [Bacteroidota bacterium]